MSDKTQAEEIYTLLVQNYVEDDDATLRFDYSIEFLQWTLSPPDQPADWIFGVRGGGKKKLWGFITGIPITLTVNGKTMKMAEINFLCVHKKFRTKKLAPILIKEVTRRVHLHNIWQAMFTAGALLPTPVGEPVYWHRSINTKKLIECRFSHLPLNTPMNKYVKRYVLPDKPSIPKIRPMQEKDVPEVHKLLNEYLSQFQFHISYTPEEIAHFFLPRQQVIESFVIPDENGAITDFISFYSLPSTVLENDQHSRLEAAYSYYHVPNKYSMKDLMYEALIQAKLKGYDVMNALNIMHNDDRLFEELKFTTSEGNLYYYLYNWRVKKLPNN